ncbi:hypothetical protein RclHR1_00710014 [Rhizophagus clarus]|uniref:Uncharacterized protein n=1 Tax=Rhizophagus clarus TaxID=94130 RepID=A0A2Z6S1F3_9GLOM|nr:hypothetical protein RclHR1_00710014 [Rhizophagus clarus]GES81548.1 hypothetical protein RCL_jg1462.t1 [Rhizophagus clarus]
MTLTGNEFKNTLKTKVKRTLYRNFRNIKHLLNRKFFEKVDRRFGHSKEEELEFFTHLANITGFESGIIEVIYKSREEVASDLYYTDIICLGKNTDRLRS